MKNINPTLFAVAPAIVGHVHVNSGTHNTAFNNNWDADSTQFPNAHCSNLVGTKSKNYSTFLEVGAIATDVGDRFYSIQNLLVKVVDSEKSTKQINL